MKRKFRVCARIQLDDGKVIWPDTGMQVTLRDDGKMTLFDARTGQNYFLFEKDQTRTNPAGGTGGNAGQRGPGTAPGAGSAVPNGPEDFDDDIPF